MKKWLRLAAIGQQGFALPLTLFALTLLALLAAALAGVTASELEAGRLVAWDRRALYLAEAGVEHQLFRFKANRNASAVGVVDLGGSPLRARYTVTIQPSGPGGACADDPGEDESWWEVTSRGQLVQGANLVHERSVFALVEVRYQPALGVAVCRWTSG